MNRSLKRNIGLLGTALASFIISLLLQYISFYSLNENGRVRRFENTFQEKEQKVYSLFEDIMEELEGMQGMDYFTAIQPIVEGEVENGGLQFYIFERDSLVFWTGNTVSPGNINQKEDGDIIFLGNNWSVAKERIVGSRRILGLILIKFEYPYENLFLRNNFHQDFNVPEGTGINTDPGDDGYLIHDSWEKAVFALDFDHVPGFSPFQSQLSILLYYLGIFLFLLYVRHLIRSIKDSRRKNTGILLAAVILVLLNAILLKIRVPAHMSGMEVFSPQLYASSNILPSLAGLLTTSFFVFFLVYIFYYEFNPGNNNNRGKVFHILEIVFFTVLVFYFQIIVVLFRSLIVHSSISFETFRVLDITVFTFIGLFILALHFAAFTMLLDKFFRLLKPGTKGMKSRIYLLAFAVMTFLAGFFQHSGPDLVLVLLITLIAGVVSLIRGSEKFHFSYSSLILLIFLYSLVSVYQIRKYSEEKRQDDKMVLAVDISAEHDPVAELLLKNLELDISSDQELAYLLHEGYVDHMVIDDYLRGNYFGGFWEKYDMHFTLCSPVDSLYIEPNIDVWYPCYDFFEDLFADSRFRIPGSRFYFVDNMSGLISYFAGFKYFSADSLTEASLFLELDSRLVTEELGYPELLLRERPRKEFFLRDYTYAKYSGGQLITQTGGHTYSLKPGSYTSGEEEFEYTSFDGYEHLAYNVDPFNTIVVSNKKVNLVSILITFTYIFVFFYLLLTIILLLINIPFLKSSLQLNIKNKIQYTMIGILLLSLLLTGGGTILFSIRQYKERHFDSLSEKIQSVYIEVMHKLEFETDLSQGWQAAGYANLDELLKKFSNVFFTDINLYDPQGSLLATSRSEVFENQLLGPGIHPAAYTELAIRNAAEYVQEETIGSLRYLSAYVPFRNYENKLLAYLNLPYFTRQQVLTMEITNLVVAVVNFYVLLITISILIAVFISGQITQPLRMLQSKFGKISFGTTNEKIQYNARDEIGVLVREYNHMVDELAVSASKLAKSERESAWREMAKQIAHEIKNPLTPMRLSAQHLQRSTEEDPAKQKENIQRMTQTLIEQIDHLSAIATEFSNFAKMPRANNEEVNLQDQIRKISELFLNSEQININTSFDFHKPALVFADPEQLSRVFINLLKNAIQSIPEEREGKIGVRLETGDGLAKVKVMDNGRGIPSELSDKLFQPNFTTKSSGMGMGLAIVKSIIENAGGNISFETELGKGTTFIVVLPLISEEKV